MSYKSLPVETRSPLTYDPAPGSNKERFAITSVLAVIVLMRTVSIITVSMY